MPGFVKAPKNGYAYIYVSNESDEMVYFDNLQVAQVHGRILEENHYYAYGLKIAALSSRKLADSREGHAGNFNLYNDKELFEEADLGWYDYGFRHYDPQIGRFPQFDPLTDAYPYYTPYQYAGCEPIANIDMDGLEPLGAIKWGTTFHQALDPVTFTYKAASVGKNIATSVASMASKALNFVGKQLTKENLSKAADVVTDFIPIVSGARRYTTVSSMVTAGRYSWVSDLSQRI